MSKLIKIESCAMCSEIEDLGHGKLKCVLANKELPENFPLFPSWCPLPDRKPYKWDDFDQVWGDADKDFGPNIKSVCAVVFKAARERRKN